MIKAFENYEIWWVTGAQLLYGGDAVVAVDGHSKEMVAGLNDSGIIPIKVVYKGTANSSKEVEAVMKAANNDEKCVGIITWMHTFSPAKMWIKGLPSAPPRCGSRVCRICRSLSSTSTHSIMPRSPGRRWIWTS